MTDWIQSIATIILGAATIALFWVTKTLAHSTDRLARISGQDFRAKHSPIPQLLWSKETAAIEGGNIVLKGAIRSFPGSPPMTLVHVLAESSVQIAGAGPHVEILPTRPRRRRLGNPTHQPLLAPRGKSDEVGVWGAMERKVRLATAVSGVSERPELARATDSGTANE